MKLPGGDNVEIDQRKLTDYALSPTHPVGKHKARLFALKLGLTRDDAPVLIEALRKPPLRKMHPRLTSTPGAFATASTSCSDFPNVLR